MVDVHDEGRVEIKCGRRRQELTRIFAGHIEHLKALSNVGLRQNI